MINCAVCVILRPDLCGHAPSAKLFLSKLANPRPRFSIVLSRVKRQFTPPLRGGEDYALGYLIITLLSPSFGLGLSRDIQSSWRAASFVQGCIDFLR